MFLTKKMFSKSFRALYLYITGILFDKIMGKLKIVIKTHFLLKSLMKLLISIKIITYLCLSKEYNTIW